MVLELLPNSAGASATVSWAFSSNEHLTSWVLSNPQFPEGETEALSLPHVNEWWGLGSNPGRLMPGPLA